MYPNSIVFLKKSCLNTRASVNEMYCYVLSSFLSETFLDFCRRWPTLSSSRYLRMLGKSVQKH